MGSNHSNLVVLSVSTIVAASTYVLYQHLNRNLQLQVTSSLTSEISRLSNSIHKLQRDIDDLKEFASSTTCTSKRAAARSISNRTNESWEIASVKSNRTNESEIHSKSGEEEDEFYDFDSDDSESKAPIVPQVFDSQSEFFATMDKLNDGCEEDQIECYNQLIQKVKQFSDNAEFLWRLARATRCMAGVQEAQNHLDKKKEYVYDAIKIATRALQIDENNAEVHKWYGIVVGCRGEFVSIREKIEDGYLFKSHIDKASKLNPSDPVIYHLLGRFCYEVTSLSWFERKIAATLFASPPESSYNEALSHFLRTEELRSSPWKENQMCVGKCYLGLGNYKHALYWLDAASETPTITSGDKLAQKEILQLLAKYSTYR